MGNAFFTNGTAGRDLLLLIYQIFTSSRYLCSELYKHDFLLYHCKYIRTQHVSGSRYRGCRKNQMLTALQLLPNRIFYFYKGQSQFVRFIEGLILSLKCTYFFFFLIQRVAYTSCLISISKFHYILDPQVSLKKTLGTYHMLRRRKFHQQWSEVL